MDQLVRLRVASAGALVSGMFADVFSFSISTGRHEVAPRRYTLRKEFFFGKGSRDDEVVSKHSKDAKCALYIK